jgi:hypothetical protein
MHQLHCFPADASVAGASSTDVVKRRAHPRERLTDDICRTTTSTAVGTKPTVET